MARNNSHAVSLVWGSFPWSPPLVVQFLLEILVCLTGTIKEPGVGAQCPLEAVVRVAAAGVRKNIRVCMGWVWEEETQAAQGPLCCLLLIDDFLLSAQLWFSP